MLVVCSHLPCSIFVMLLNSTLPKDMKMFTFKAFCCLVNRISYILNKTFKCHIGLCKFVTTLSKIFNISGEQWQWVRISCHKDALRASSNHVFRNIKKCNNTKLKHKGYTKFKTAWWGVSNPEIRKMLTWTPEARTGVISAGTPDAGTDWTLAGVVDRLGSGALGSGKAAGQQRRWAARQQQG